MGHYPTGRPANPDLSMDSARYVDIPITPPCAFGHGLGYASFEYGDLTVSGGALALDGHVEISPAVKNTKGIDADAVVQLYVRDPVAQVARPVHEMRGFARVSIPAGETRRVSCTLKPEQFACFAPSGRIDLAAPVISRAPGEALATHVDFEED